MSNTAREQARLFLALWPPTDVRDAVLAAADAWQWPAAARRTRPERLHATLHFIGAVPDERLDELKQGLAVRFEPLTWELSVPDLWPGGIAVLRPAAVPEPLLRLHERLAQALHGLQLPLDPRPWQPHVTLARKAQGLHLPAPLAPLPWRADDGYALVRTLSGGRGYESLARFA